VQRDLRLRRNVRSTGLLTYLTADCAIESWLEVVGIKQAQHAAPPCEMTTERASAPSRLDLRNRTAATNQPNYLTARIL
jgi:hypothetical protein